MATRTGPEPSAIAGLDRLESGPPPPGAGIVRFARSAWAAAWPKLLAVALVLVIWQLVHLTGWKSYVIKGPQTVLPDLWVQLHHAPLWQSIGITLRRAGTGYALAIVAGSAVRLLVAPT